jgi:hypothetical protein
VKGILTISRASSPRLLSAVRTLRPPSLGLTQPCSGISTSCQLAIISFIYWMVCVESSNVCVDTGDIPRRWGDKMGPQCMATSM